MDVIVMLYIWIAVICIAALVEAFTMQMVSIWFVAGGIVSLILYFCGVSYEIQIIAFIAVSIILLISLRKLCLKFLLKNTDEKTNIDSLIGREAKLLKSISLGELGEVKLGDVVWTATTKDETPLSAGMLIKIVQVQGNKLIVQPIENASKTEQGETSAKGKEEEKTAGEIQATEQEEATEKQVETQTDKATSEHSKKEETAQHKAKAQKSNSKSKSKKTN